MKYGIKTRYWLRQIFVAGGLLVLLPLSVHAQNSSSSNYQVFEAQFGSGGIEETCSVGEYCAQGSLGANAVGNMSSANFDAAAGALVPNQEYLEFNILDSQVDLGEISPSTTGTGTVDFYVRTYLSAGYSIVSAGTPPSIGAGAEIDAMAVTGGSVPGTEQFGINLVDNTAPDIGTNFTNIPDDSYADGFVSSGYDVPDQFRYVSGEIIAGAPLTIGNQGNGQTNYTISYIANVDALTPAGTYVMEHDLIAVATY